MSLPPSLVNLSDDRLQGPSAPAAAAPPLVVLLDYDNCLKTVLKVQEDPTRYQVLFDLVARLVYLAAKRANAKTVVLLSYSNRVSDDYNKHIQFKKEVGVTPTKEAIDLVAAMLTEYPLFKTEGWSFEARHGLKAKTENGGYLIDGNKAFCDAYGPEWRTKKTEIKSDLSTGWFGRHLKALLYQAAKDDNQGSSLLVFDDKWTNLCMRTQSDSPSTTWVVHLDAAKIYGTFNYDKSRKQKTMGWLGNEEDLWTNVVGEENWWTMGRPVFGEVSLEHECARQEEYERESDLSKKYKDACK